MVRTRAWSLRALALGVSGALVLAACGGAPATGGPGASTPAGTSGPGETAATGPQQGGTIHVLTNALQWNQVDPQRAYTGEDLAFFGGTIMRSLTQYIYSADPAEGTSLQPDMATDLGTATNDGATWSFTIRDGVTWQDGSDVTCEDIKYGVSRTFASDVINQGPTYASAYLDIPPNPVTDEDDPNSAFPTAYYGPYHGTGQEFFDEAVTCDGKIITFNLKSPHADFNYTVTLGFSPVPNPDDHPGIDTGETYGTTAPYVFSNGPYMVESYTTGNGGSYHLVRNPEWNPDSDPIRPAYPDEWIVHFGVDPLIIDQRLMESAGDDATAVQYGDVQPENLDTIFADPETANPDFAGRAISGFDPYSLYYWIANDRITNVKIRQAMGVALDREALRLNAGGNFAGDFADGAVKPNIGQDYAPTNLWSAAGPFGVDVPPTGDPALAQTLIQESGEAAPELVFCHPDTPVNGRAAAIVIESLGRAGLTVTANAIEQGRYYSVVYDTEGPCHFGSGGWGADWPNASTVIEPLFHSNGGWPLARVQDADFDAGVDAALSELDRGTQATMWQELNTTASEQMWHIPTLFGRSQTLAGNGVGPDPLYRWPAYGSWPYGIMYVK